MLDEASKPLIEVASQKAFHYWSSRHHLLIIKVQLLHFSQENSLVQLSFHQLLLQTCLHHLKEDLLQLKLMALQLEALQVAITHLRLSSHFELHLAFNLGLQMDLKLPIFMHLDLAGTLDSSNQHYYLWLQVSLILVNLYG